MFNDPKTKKRCDNNRNVPNTRSFIVSTRDTVPGGYFDQNINEITKIKFLD